MSYQYGVVVYKVDGSMAIDPNKCSHLDSSMMESMINSIALQQNNQVDVYAWRIYSDTDGETYTRLSNGDDFTADLDGQGNINSLDFSIEDSRKIVKLSTNVDRNRIEAFPDGTYEPLNIIVQAYENDGVTINNNYNGTVEVLVSNPSGKEVHVEATLTNGFLETPFVPRHTGVYKVREVIKNGAKIGNMLEIDVYIKAVSV